MQHIRNFTNTDFPSNERKTTVILQSKKMNSSRIYLTALKVLAVLYLGSLVTILNAAEHNVEMKNVGVDGTMVFETVVSGLNV